MPLRPSGAGYEELRTGKDESTHPPITRETTRIPLRNRGWVQIFIVIFISLIFSGIGAAVGRRYATMERKFGLLGMLCAKLVIE